jgi:hypothetical protein
MAKTPQQAAQKWANGMANSADAIKQGVMGMTENPAAKAAAVADRTVSAFAAAKGKMVAGLNATSLSTIQQAMITKGIPRIQDGAAAAQPKVANVLGQIMAHVNTVVASLPARGTDAQNEQRMLQFSRGMKKFKKNPGS